MALAEGVATLAGKEVFKKTVSGVYDFITKKTGRKLRQWNTERKMEGLYRNIEKVRKVKTIWQVDKAVDLTAFYCDSNVKINGDRIRIEELADLPPGNILIEGIAGQGKSILLRYLCSVELAIAHCIPVFVELRRVTESHTLRDRIYTVFQTLGLSVDDDLFDALADSGKILLLLDAFDEVPDDHKPRVLTEIEDIAGKKSDLRIIVTSRPNTTIKMSNQFRVVTLDNLIEDEYVQVIQKVAAGQRWAENLVSHVKTQASHIEPLLCTPLMVTLLVFCYKSYQKLPTKLSDFYDSLFQTLLQRHDGTKPGFTRERLCALDDLQYRQLFESLCINAKKTLKQSFSYESIYQVTKSAVVQCGFDVNPQSYLDDIVKITCLVLRDGEEYRFIHKTVQEYYTAAYVSKKPESWVLDFYSRLRGERRHYEWNQELAFLSEIDTHRFDKYYFFPGILNLLGITENDFQRKQRKLSLTQIREIMAQITVSFVGREFMEAEHADNSIFDSFLGEELFIKILDSMIDQDLSVTSLPDGQFSLTGDKLIDSVIPRDVCRAIIGDYLHDLFETGKRLKESLEAAENQDFLDGLL